MNHSEEYIVQELKNRSYTVFVGDSGSIVATRRRNHIEVSPKDGRNRYLVNRGIVKNLYQALSICDEQDK